MPSPQIPAPPLLLLLTSVSPVLLLALSATVVLDGSPVDPLVSSPVVVSVGSLVVASVVATVVASVVGAFYYLRLVKVMYFDEPATAFGPTESRLNSGLIGATAIFCSPVGMLAITPLVTAATRAAQSIL